MKNLSAVMTSLQNIEILERPMPVFGSDDVLLKIEYCGVCGSDVHFFEEGCIGARKVEYPHVLGHEASGEVVAVGDKVGHLKVGTKVFVEPGIPCGHCEFCRSGRYNLCPDLVFLSCPPYDGLLSSYVAVPASMVYPLPEGVSTLEGALMEPLAVGVYAARRGEVRANQTVVILGSGCIGLCTLLACRQRGASRIIVCDLFQNRLDRALELGADEVVNASECDSVERILELTGGQGANVVFETAGNRHTAAQTSFLVRTGGLVVIVGNVLGDVPFNFRNLMLKEADVKTIWRYQNVFPDCADMVSRGGIAAENLRRIVDGIFPFADTQKAFMTAMTDKQHIVKAVVQVSE
jgi:L-iditol 2-dehydrogenase